MSIKKFYMQNKKPLAITLVLVVVLGFYVMNGNTFNNLWQNITGSAGSSQNVNQVLGESDCAPMSLTTILPQGQIDKVKGNLSGKAVTDTTGQLQSSGSQYASMTGQNKNAFGKELKSILKKRQAAIIDALDNGNDEAVFSSVLGFKNERSALAQTGSNCLEQESVQTGKILTGHVHDKDMKEVEDYAFLDKGDGTRLRVYAPEPMLEAIPADKTVNINGYVIGNRFIVDVSIPHPIQVASNFSLFPTAEAYQADAFGPQPTILMAVKQSGYNPTSVNFNTVISDLNNHVSQGSLGKATVTGTVATGGWINLPYDPCNQSSTATLTDAIAAADPSVNFTQYKRMIWMYNGPSCQYSGTDMIGTKTSFVTADGTVQIYDSQITGGAVSDPSFYLHEYWHSFGIGHASSFNCNSATAPAGAPSDIVSGCTRSEYGSYYSIMGHGLALPDMVHFDEIWGAQVTEVTAPGSYTIEPRESVTTGVKGIKVKYGSGSYLYAEYRQPTSGYDVSGLAGTDATQGALVYITSGGNHSNIIDATPPGTGLSSALLVGQTLTTPVTGATFTVTAKTASSLTLQVTPGTPDLVPPTIQLTSPASDATVPLAPVTLTATASDDHHVYAVQFFESSSGSVIGTDYTAPYQATWTPAQTGNYYIYARSIDDALNVTTGGQEHIYVGSTTDITPPVGVISSPANGATVTGVTNVSVVASDNKALDQVELYRDAVTPTNLLGTQGCNWTVLTACYPTFSIDFSTFTTGSHTLYVKVSDAAGNIYTSSPTTINVAGGSADTTPPTISSIATSNITANSGTITWTTNEAADTQVMYGDSSGSYPNTSVLNPILSTSHSVTITSLVPGISHYFKVKSKDAAGNLATSNPENSFVTSAMDTTPPTVSMTAPTSGTTLSSTTLVSANAADNVGVDHVDFLSNGTVIGADASSPYSINWNTTTVTNGTYTLTAKAYDAMGNFATSTGVSITVNNVVIPPDTTPPTVSMTAPAGGATVLGAAVTVSASASDNTGVTIVSFYNDGTLITSDTTGTPDFAVTWNTTTTTNGAHTLTAKACDAVNNCTTSSGISVTVNNPTDTTPPIVTITAPTSATLPRNGNVNVTATATDASGISGINISIDGVIKKTCASPATTCTYKWGMNTASNGTHTLAATAYDGSINHNLGTATPKTVTK